MSSLTHEWKHVVWSTSPLPPLQQFTHGGGGGSDSRWRSVWDNFHLMQGLVLKLAKMHNQPFFKPVVYLLLHYNFSGVVVAQEVEWVTVRLLLSTCQSGLGQGTEPQIAPDDQARTLHSWLPSLCEWMSGKNPCKYLNHKKVSKINVAIYHTVRLVLWHILLWTFFSSFLVAMETKINHFLLTGWRSKNQHGQR